ncbi:discoidin domain-containing protein [Citrobacter freundii]|uniref:discoidin domain-containing protein n=1 Tax=Citrobacter freundii TaxID=546 RepID=UPI0015E9D35C|nr:discoidin domain-containing protein [Citrobacter freundii]QLY70536.1 discoidin domain-containing protein [Citrobacter freundii]
MLLHDGRTVNLQGEWRVKIDPQDTGIDEKWFENRVASAGFHIPGTCAEHRLGEHRVLAPGLTKEAVQCLRTEYTYQGAAWYQTDICLTDCHADKHIILFLERVMGETQLWVDGVAVGRQDSLSTPHQFDITRYISEGKTQQITLRIDNRDIQNIGDWPSARTDQTQTIWNGIVGKVELQIQDRHRLNHLLVAMDSQSRQTQIRIDKEPVIADWQNIMLTLTLRELNGRVIQQEVQSLQTKPDQPTITLDFLLADRVILWDEFTPQQYRLAVEIQNLADLSSTTAVVEKTTGFRQLNTRDGVLKINGTPRFLRGNIDCCIYPLTGYPPTTETEWTQVFKQLKNHGLNHVRFHSWCPPESAFICADREGLYLQVEGPVWMDNWMDFPVGKHPEHYHWLPEEAERIIRTWSIHPSFCIFSNGNELNGDFQILRDIVQRLKNIQPQILYTLTSNWDRTVAEEDDLFITQSSAGIGVRGQYFLDQLAEATTLNFSAGIQAQQIPVISHEVGQYVVYPNVAEIPRYTGCLTPVNLQRIRDDLEQKNLLPYLNDFVHSSGKLALLLYKMEIEAALRTRNMGGIQLLSLHDFPGQSTATVGLLDAFYVSKNIVPAETFRHFCCETVPLVMMPTLFYTCDDDFVAEVQIAHYGAEPLHQVTLQVHIIGENQQVLFAHDVFIDEVPLGLLKQPLTIHAAPFNHVTGRQAMQVKAEIRDTPYQNQWDIWVYGKTESTSLPASVSLCHEWSEAIERRLQNGENILLLPSPSQVAQLSTSTWFPVFWSPVHFASKDPCGMIIDNQHPLFSRYFPCENYATLEWKSLLENSFAMNIDSLDRCDPLTLLTPNFFHNHKSTNLFECRVGQGRLMICTLNIEANSHNGVSEQLKSALYRYLASADFMPCAQLGIAEIRALLTTANPDEEAKTDLALGHPAHTDSMKSMNYGPLRGNDGNPSTSWIAADAEAGHYWQVDFGSVLPVTSTKIVFNENAVYAYVIQSSLDGESWDVVVNKTHQVTAQQTHEDEFDVETRFLRIVYQGLTNGIWAGHRQFSAYGLNLR